MAMSKRDYELIAGALHEELSGDLSVEAACGIEYLTVSLADRFTAQNPRFDRARFVRAAMGDIAPVTQTVEEVLS